MSSVDPLANANNYSEYFGYLSYQFQDTIVITDVPSSLICLLIKLFFIVFCFREDF